VKLANRLFLLFSNKSLASSQQESAQKTAKTHKSLASCGLESRPYQLFVMPFFLLVLFAVGISGVIYFQGRVECVGYIGAMPKWYLFFISTVSFQCFELFVYIFVIMSWLKYEMQRRIIPRRDEGPKSVEERIEEWDRCCKCCCKYTALCCCFSFGGRGIQHEDFHSMSNTLAHLFDDDGNLDVVASDIIAALMAISMEQEEKKGEYVEQLKKHLEKSRSSGSSLDIDKLKQATTSRAVIITEQLNAILKVVLGGDIEAADLCGGGSTPVLPTSNDGNSEGGNAFIFKEDKSDPDEKGMHVVVRKLLSANNDTDRYLVAEGTWFLRYSIAINTWKNYIFMNLTTNCCKLTYARCYELPKYRKQGELDDGGPAKAVIGENAFGLHEAALMKVVGFDGSKVQLCYAHFDENVVNQAVYCIMIDHAWKSVVLAIRGSLSLEDYVVNLNVEPEELGAVGAEYGFDGSGEYCHKGYLARAKWLCNDLNQHGILDELLDRDSGRYRDYTLRVQGHSLGAGTAAPVALMLRNKYPDLRCLCFAPPGGLFSKDLAARCEDFVTTYVVNTDLVPRISARTVEQLRDEVLTMIARIKVPKRQLAQIHRSAKKVNELPCGMKELLYDADAIPDSEYKIQLDRFRRFQETKERDRVDPSIPLYPPGRFIHLVKTKSSNESRMTLQGRFMISDIFNMVTCDKFVPEEEYVPRWAYLSDFDEIVVSSTLVSDHMVDIVESSLGGVADAFGVDPSRPPIVRE